MSASARFWDALRTSFAFVPGLALVAAVVLGLALPALDRALEDRFGSLAFGGEAASARAVLQTIATVTSSVAGVTFSVTLVALTLASQQLSPRVLRTFQARRLYQVVLAAFLGTFVFSLLVLMSVRERPAVFVPELAVSLAVSAAILSFALLVVFIDDLVRSVQASTVIRRIAEGSHASIERPYPEGIGAPPEDAVAAARATEERMRAASFDVRACRAGFLVTVDGGAVVAAAAEREGLVLQLVEIGDFVLTEQPVARVWCDPGQAEELHERVRDAFQLGQERTTARDLAFSIRQLADVGAQGALPFAERPDDRRERHGFAG